MNHGGRIVARVLRSEGIGHVFTLCGGHIQHIYDGCLDEGIRVVDVRHEQTAGHAADAYARMTGRPGVALVTAGPGVTDVVTAVANAQRAGVPMVVLGGAGPWPNRHMGSLQDMDHVALMSSITKWSATVTETRRIEEYLASAFRAALTGVPGPVFLEFPLDVLMNWIDDAQLVRATGSRPIHSPSPDPAAVDSVNALLKMSERPVAIVGSQLRCSPAQNALGDFLARVPMPAFVNGMARGALPWDHPCFFRRVRRFALSEADLVLVFGTPFDFRLTYGTAIAKDAKVVQVDLEGSEIGKNRHVDVGIPADSGLTLQAIARSAPQSNADDWIAKVREQENRQLAAMQSELQSNDDPPNPLRVCAETAKYLEEDSVVIGDGGDFVATAAYSLPVSWPGVWMDPGPLGTLGVGPGYAMAAKLVRPNARVIIMYGDGSFGLHAMEWEAMARQNIPVVGIVGNDGAWTQIRRGQVQMFGESRSVATKLDFTRYDRVVDACGGVGFWASTVSELQAALENAFSCDRPALVNVQIGESGFRKNAISV